MSRFAVALCLVLVSAMHSGARAAPLELFFDGGPATWSKCGEIGCWRQPPLQSNWNLRTQAQAVGLQWGDVEFAYRNLGEASVCGEYVQDADYDPHAAALKNKRAERFRICTAQHTNGLSLMYAPRWTAGSFRLQPSIGVLRISQTQDVRWFEAGKGPHISSEGSPTASLHLYSTNRFTPAAGLKVFYRFDNVVVGAGAEWFPRPRFVNSLAGGGSESRIGLRVRFLEVRVVFWD